MKNLKAWEEISQIWGQYWSNPGWWFPVPSQVYLLQELVDLVQKIPSQVQLLRPQATAAASRLLRFLSSQ